MGETWYDCLLRTKLHQYKYFTCEINAHLSREPNSRSEQFKPIFRYKMQVEAISSCLNRLQRANRIELLANTSRRCPRNEEQKKTRFGASKPPILRVSFTSESFDLLCTSYQLTPLITDTSWLEYRDMATTHHTFLQHHPPSFENRGST